MEKIKISKDEVAYVAHLARLEFGEEETEKFTSQLNDILLYMDKLDEVDTAGVEPVTHAIAQKNAFRRIRSARPFPGGLPGQCAGRAGGALWSRR